MCRHALGSRVCPGCGEAFEPRRPNQWHCGPTCRKRAQRSRGAQSDPYELVVWKARSLGAIDFYEAVELLVHPSEAVQDRLAVAA